jgi:hypothetical protein
MTSYISHDNTTETCNEYLQLHKEWFATERMPQKCKLLHTLSTRFRSMKPLFVVESCDMVTIQQGPEYIQMSVFLIWQSPSLQRGIVVLLTAIADYVHCRVFGRVLLRRLMHATNCHILTHAPAARVAAGRLRSLLLVRPRAAETPTLLARPRHF